MHTQQRNKNIRVFKFIFSIVLIFTFSVCLYIFNQYQQIEKNEVTRINNNHVQGLNFASERLKNVVEEVDDILKKLITSPQVSLYTQNHAERDRTALENMFYFIAKNEHVYSQIRYLDNAGIEQIRVNNLPKTTVRVDDALLQNKSSRPYFKYAQQLQEGEIGTWKMDLEVENGELIQPIQASFRVIAPIFIQHRPRGFIVINLSINHILSTIGGLQADNVVTKIVNENGYFLASDNPSEILGNVLIANQHHNIANNSPSMWQKMTSIDNGQFFYEDITYSFTKLGLNPAFAPLGKYILMESPTSSTHVLAQKHNLMVNAILLLILAIGVCFYIFKLYNNHETDVMNNQLIEAAFNGVAGVIITNKFLRLMKVNQEFVRISGYSEKELQGESLRKLQLSLSTENIANIKAHLSEFDVWKGEIQGQSKSGSDFALITRIQVLKSIHGKIKKYVITFIDISQRKQLEEELRNQSQSDALTNVWNRRKFDYELANLAMFSKRYPSDHACLGMIDIDFFKKINDAYGHDVGDKTLKDLADFLQSQCRETDIIARIGGEEFAILMPKTDIKHGLMVLNRLRERIESNTQLGFTISGGITPILPDATLTYKHADIALYNAKSSGRNQVKPFNAKPKGHKPTLSMIDNINNKPSLVV